MATNRVWNDQSGQRKDASEFHTVIAWSKLGDIAAKYLKKGGLVMIEGRIQTRNWTGQDNVKRYFTEIIAESLQLGPRTDGGGGISKTPYSEMSDIRKTPPADDIPIINENEPTASGLEEDEMKINEKDLPF